MKIVIENCKCPSWNDMQSAHWTLRSAEKKTIQEMIYVYARNMGEKITIPAIVKIEAHFKENKRRDPDNLFVKPILDGLVQARIFEDDNGKIIDWVSLKAEVKMPSDKIIIFINE
jgi:Holliday junction resolvase RusA-like endonuclease